MRKRFLAHDPPSIGRIIEEVFVVDHLAVREEEIDELVERLMSLLMIGMVSFDDSLGF